MTSGDRARYKIGTDIDPLGRHGVFEAKDGTAFVGLLGTGEPHCKHAFDSPDDLADRIVASGQKCPECALVRRRLIRSPANGGTLLDRARDEFLAGKQPVRPTFLVAYGPPGSGKSTVVASLYADAERRIRADEIVDIDVDAIVQLVSGYAEKREKAKTADERSAVYWDARREADPVSTALLNEALLTRYSVRWETTGGSIAWTVRELDRIKRLQYRIWLVYPVVDVAELKRRLRQREAAQTGARNVEEFVVRARKNLPELIPFIDRLIVYDNSGPSGTQTVLFEITRRYTGDVSTGGDLGIVEKCIQCTQKDPERFRRLLGPDLYRDLTERCERCIARKKEAR